MYGFLLINKRLLITCDTGIYSIIMIKVYIAILSCIFCNQTRILLFSNICLLFSVKEKVSTISCHQSKPSGIKSIPVNSEQFVKLEETRVPVDDRFFHRYFLFLVPVIIPRHLKKCGVLCYTLQKKFAFECPSVRPSVRPSAFRFRALS